MKKTISDACGAYAVMMMLGVPALLWLLPKFGWLLSTVLGGLSSFGAGWR